MNQNTESLQKQEPNEKTPAFNIYVMSYMRPNRIMTQDHFEYCTYVVREEEAELYRKGGVKNILAIPSGKVHDFMSTFYWIIENTPEDVICIVDDDAKHMLYRMDYKAPIAKADLTPDTEKATAECERIAQMLYDLDLGLAFDNPQPAPYVYHSEFVFKGMPGHIRWVNKRCFKAKYNKDDPATSDIDMAMQELLLNRIILLPLYYCTETMPMDTDIGYSSGREHHNSVQYAMMNKWKQYYSYDFKKNTAKINVVR